VVGAEEQILDLKCFASFSPSQIPSDPMYPLQAMSSPIKEAQDGNGGATHPLPVVIQPFLYELQSKSVTKVALLQTRAVQIFPPFVPSQIPSVPFSAEQVTSSPKYEEQTPKMAVQPFPVVKHS